jgi:hypothetical protein
MVFVDTSMSVSSTRYLVILSSYIGTSTTFGLNTPVFDFVGYHGIPRSSRLYCVAHGLDDSFGASYYDPTLRVTVFPTISPTPSQVVGVQLP